MVISLTILLVCFFFQKPRVSVKKRAGRGLFCGFLSKIMQTFVSALQIISQMIKYHAGTHLCFLAFALHFQILGQFSIFVKLSIQGVKWKLRYRGSQIWKFFGLVTKQKAHKIVKTCKKLWQKDILFQKKLFFLWEVLLIKKLEIQ